jgi:methionyl aminopeptidase
VGIVIKNERQIGLMRSACRIVAETFQLLEGYIQAGIATKELDRLAEGFIRSKGAVPSFLGYRLVNDEFPASICVSVNEEVIHGIPGKRRLADGDIVSIDIGAYKDGFHGDAARTYPVGSVSPDRTALIDVTKRSFFEAIMYARNGRHLHEMSAAVDSFVSAYGYSVVREFCGHGVGRQMHEDPQIPFCRQQSRGPRLQKGMTLAIEPMVNAGTHEVRILNDNWTVVTTDGKCSAHYENTILITDGAPEILTVI